MALAIKLNASKCYIFSDVDGVYEADPNIIKNARKLSNVSYSNMENAASEGAKVLCERSVSLADKYNINIIAKSTFNDNKGTSVGNKIEEKNYKNNSMENYGMKLYVKNDKILKVEINNINYTNLKEIIKDLNNQNIKIKNFISKKDDVIFIFNDYLKEEIYDIFNKRKIDIHFKQISEISFVGTGISNNNLILKNIFETIENSKENLMESLICFEVHANVISMFFDKVISENFYYD